MQIAASPTEISRRQTTRVTRRAWCKLSISAHFVADTDEVPRRPTDHPFYFSMQHAACGKLNHCCCFGERKMFKHLMDIIFLNQPIHFNSNIFS
jgi:hypothetical protein